MFWLFSSLTNVYLIILRYFSIIFSSSSACSYLSCVEKLNRNVASDDLTTTLFPTSLLPTYSNISLTKSKTKSLYLMTNFVPGDKLNKFDRTYKQRMVFVAHFVSN